MHNAGWPANFDEAARNCLVCHLCASLLLVGVQPEIANPPAHQTQSQGGILVESHEAAQGLFPDACFGGWSSPRLIAAVMKLRVT